MSGFDFDALRDRDAPYPGTRERAAVDARARQLRGRQRRNRLTASATSVVAVAAVVFGVIATTRDTSPEIAVRGGSTTTTVTSPTTVGPSVDNRFIPPTSVHDGLVTLPVTLPDGETFTMHYPPAMKIAELGFAGGGGVVGFSGVSSRQVSIGYTNVQRVFGDIAPRSIFHDVSGRQVALYPGSEQTGKLAFEFGPWLVQVDDDNYAMTDTQLATWARNLTGAVDANGYLVLHAESPLVVANWFDGGFGGSAKGNVVELADHLYCGQPESDTAAHRHFTNGDGTRGVSWCDGDLHVVASGTLDFVDLADRGLQVTTPTPPVGPTPTFPSITSTTATTPASTSAGAMSASWVSPSHGWALEQSGSVVETTDAGATWTAIGRLGNRDPDTKIRFADATRGFAYNSRYLAETTDGGAHWTVLHAPFSDVLDLEVTRGIAYAVAFPPANGAPQLDFELWSAPVDTLTWSEHSLKLAINAGGAPSEQLVFAGDQGWVLDVMRTVMGGGRLVPGADWAKWNPPCPAVYGPAFLAASTGSDVVAACDEGVWGGNSPKITPAIYFSHNGGVSFDRHLAPGFGLVSSPNPTTAVIATTNGLQRTTDGGSTWESVLPDSGGFGASDMGFTTSTQGFVILENGAMFMTHDAGATWPRARLP